MAEFKKICGEGQDLVFGVGKIATNNKGEGIYSYQIRVNYPTWFAGLAEGPPKIFTKVGLNRIASVAGSKVFNKKTSYTDEDAEAFLVNFATDSGWLALTKKRGRKTVEAVSGPEKKALESVAVYLYGNSLGIEGIDARIAAWNSLNKTDKTLAEEYKAKAKAEKAEDSSLWRKAYKKVLASFEL